MHFCKASTSFHVQKQFCIALTKLHVATIHLSYDIFCRVLIKTNWPHFWFLLAFLFCDVEKSALKKNCEFLCCKCNPCFMSIGMTFICFFVEWIIIDLFYSLQVRPCKKLNHCSKWLLCSFYCKIELSYLMLLLFSKPQKRRGISASLLFLSYKIKTPLVSISALEWVSLLVHSYKEVIDIALLKTKLCAKYQLWNYERLISEQDAAY